MESRHDSANTSTNHYRHPQTVILLDIDGVLNPRLVSDGPDSAGQERLVLSPPRAELVHRLAAMGQLVWVTTWPAAVAHRLTGDLGVTPVGRVPLNRLDPGLPTPKLPAVQRWVERMEATGDLRWDLLAWIDDELSADAYTWAQYRMEPTMLLQPRAQEGLQEHHLQTLRETITKVYSQLHR